MRLSRRSFLAGLAALGAGACTPLRAARDKVARLTPDLSIGGDGKVVFAAVNDLHLKDAKSAAFVNHALAQVNEIEDLDFTVVLGDLATDGAYSELSLAKTCLDRLERPYYTVPGNHDVDATQRDPYKSYTHFFGETQWMAEHEGWQFIGMDTCVGTASDVSVPPERIEWLKAGLRRIRKERPIALFTHHPFNPNSAAYRVKNADDVLACFEGHNLRLVASGHYHGNQTEEQNGVLFTTTACCSSTRGNHDGTDSKGFRLFRLEGESVTHEFVEVSAKTARV